MVLMQGLIQWVVALEHHRRGNPRGALALLDRAWGRLAGARPGELDLDWAPLQAAHADLRRAFAAWADGGPRPAVTAPPLRRLPGDPRPPAGPAG
jgi:hypothetical protein